MTQPTPTTDVRPALPDVVQFDLNADNFLNRAAAALPGTLLAWHYRNRHETSETGNPSHQPAFTLL